MTEMEKPDNGNEEDKNAGNGEAAENGSCNDFTMEAAKASIMDTPTTPTTTATCFEARTMKILMQIKMVGSIVKQCREMIAARSSLETS